jgi:broad specificity phosphatase PhoE
MVQILLIRPGATDFDDQGRIKGTLDLPLSDSGTDQVIRLVHDLHNVPIDYLYTCPSTAAQQTAEAIAGDHRIKVRRLDELQNLDHGLWQGKRIDEVKQSQPKVYRQLQEHPETVVPPEGEPVGHAIDRVRQALAWILKKHKSDVVALVVPEPCASFVRSVLQQAEVGDLWKAECKSGGWQAIDVPTDAVPAALGAT